MTGVAIKNAFHNLSTHKDSRGNHKLTKSLQMQFCFHIGIITAGPQIHPNLLAPSFIKKFSANTPTITSVLSAETVDSSAEEEKVAGGTGHTTLLRIQTYN